MAISTISHTVCLDCSQNEFTVTGSLNGGTLVGSTTNSLSITDPNGNVVVYDNATIGGDLYTAPFTYTVSAGSTIITGGGSVSQATLNWTATANTTYSFILRTTVNGYVQDYPLSFTTGASPTNDDIGVGIRDAVNALPSGLGLATVVYTAAATSLTIEGQTNPSYYFGVDALLNLTASGITPSPSGSSSATFTDGKYTVTWSLTDNSITHTSVTESYFLCDVECCVRGKMSAIDIDCDCTGDKATDAAIESMLMLQGIKAAAACGKDAKADKLLVGLQAICNNDCKSC
tara:strand:- start:1480 stop:2346 length:867 start_codon:yes stop_codon:yes gene_type:complete